MSPPNPRSTEALAMALGTSLAELKATAKRVLAQISQLEQHADYVAAIAQGRPVRIRGQKRPVDGRPVGRPRGSPNSGITVFATPEALQRLRRELQSGPSS